MPETDQQPTTNGQSPWQAQAAAAEDARSEHPELLIGAALLGGIVLAQVLKRLGGED